MTDVLVPKLNNQDTEYLIVEWLVGDGEPVRAGEAVAVLETSKAADEIEAEASGRLVHAAAKDTWIAPGAVLARVLSEDAVPQGPSGDASGTPAGAAGSLITAPARAAMRELGVAEDRVLALGLPLVRRADVERLAAASASAGGTETEDSGVGGADADHTEPDGTGAGGANADHTETDGATGSTAGRHGLSRVQRAVARAVTLSHRTIPSAYTVMRFDVGPALERARALTREVRRPVGLPELFVRAVAGLHGRFPLLFASVGEEAGGASGGPAGPVVRLSDAPRVGVTFDLGEGLYVPVIHETGSLRDIAATMMRHRLAAATGDFREKDLTGANITVTLHTDADVVLAVPIVLPGTAAALAVTSPRPETVLAADGSVTTRTVADIGLAYDHRLVNGRDAALFLAALREELD
ncbi:dihydrolipoamide acetyltransferase component of pyruvate dehydrogenase complex [Planobispora rosea]|uniref:Dihydrolipoamide acetyltransferase component of pyruvate dehydrogenase complex n=1 Tax=Planobispora rosea TaxID=35762 RepID=A0A8J3RX46_PLARO|nr:2-oxo acid dehydrogenase subunit E2 [Planobispora rosea]GGS46923.1 dihydrolipoamide acetyltransferase component of pyruvate dehydrogenase complex [Planobispora rosea]GIH82285.1 dihydrolipoamide acetyltransferase component of pyruvate dehydrogenase complex [Planobispora rosea]